MTTHKQFQYPVSVDKAIDVQFNLEFDGSKVDITNIQIHSNYGSGLPHSPQLKEHNGAFKFYKEFESKEGNNFVGKFQYFDDEVSRGIIQKILKIKEEETPRFPD